MATSLAAKPSAPAAVAVSWVIVVVPLLWGLTFTVQNAMKLFTPAAPAAVTAPVVPAAH